MPDPHTKAIEDAAAALESHDPDCLGWQNIGPAERNHFLYEARAAVSAYLAAMKAQGWKLTPREPSEASLEVGYGMVLNQLGTGRDGFANSIKIVFPDGFALTPVAQAMHDAAPEPDDGKAG